MYCRLHMCRLWVWLARLGDSRAATWSGVIICRSWVQLDWESKSKVGYAPISLTTLSNYSILPVEALDLEDVALLLIAIEAKLINRIPPKRNR